MTKKPPAQHFLFVVNHNGKCFGPFLDHEAGSFVATLEGDREIVPLLVPRLPEEHHGPAKVHFPTEDEYRARIDDAKTETCGTLASISQEFYFARRENRVLTVRQIHSCWKALGLAIRTVESLMHYSEQVIADPCPENLVALRKAFWRNRNADDVDPHYRDRFW